MTGSFEGGRRSAQARGSVRIPPTSRLTPQPPNPGVERTPSSPCRPGGSGRARRRLPARLPALSPAVGVGSPLGIAGWHLLPIRASRGLHRGGHVTQEVKRLDHYEKAGGRHSYRTSATPESSPFYTSNRGVGGWGGITFQFEKHALGETWGFVS